MILVVDRDNQLCNRLFVAGHLIAASIEYNHRFINLGLSEYASFFPSTASDILCRYPPKARNGAKTVSLGTRERLRNLVAKLIDAAEFGRLRSLAGRILTIARSGYETTENKTPEQAQQLIFDLESPHGIQMLQSFPLIVARGPLVRAQSLFRKHQQAVRDYFRPTVHCEQRVERILAGARRMGDVVIGVHIRRHDYQLFEGGRYFFSMKDYRDYMQRFTSQFPNKKVVFLICSDTHEYRQAFRSKEYLFGTGKIDEDLYILAASDYIIGPPSTFSGWASFYGSTPLHYIRDINETPNLEDFLIQPG
jgi:hypothetical protein